jgi:hypothetical protein
MKISEMPAGREMDKLIAEKVFGYEVVKFRHSYYDLYLGYFRVPVPEEIEIGNGVDYYYRTKTSFEWNILPYYSTDNLHSTNIIEKWLSEECRSFDLTCEKETKPIWYCNFDSYPFARGETAPLAICRAILEVYTA